jgi:adenylate kinase
VSGGLVLILLGPPGAGKGTYCKELKERYHTVQISTGDIFRQAVKAGNEIGKLAKTYMDRGELVPDSVVVGTVWERIRREDCKNGFILDGFPRNVDQADALLGLLYGVEKQLALTINLDVPADILLQRLAGRRMCRSCDKGNFNIYTLKPKVDGVCDYCGGELYQRDDDTEAVILSRLKVYTSQTQPLIEYYGKKGQLANVPLKGSIADMLKAITEAIDGRAVKA